MLNSKVTHFLFIFLICGAIIMIGSKQLSRHFTGRDGGRHYKSMAATFHGEGDFETPRASLSRRTSDSSGESEHVDHLDRKDRQELKNLLDRVGR